MYRVTISKKRIRQFSDKLSNKYDLNECRLITETFMSCLPENKRVYFSKKLFTKFYVLLSKKYNIEETEYIIESLKNIFDYDYAYLINKLGPLAV